MATGGQDTKEKEGKRFWIINGQEKELQHSVVGVQASVLAKDARVVVGKGGARRQTEQRMWSESVVQAGFFLFFRTLINESSFKWKLFRVNFENKIEGFRAMQSCAITSIKELSVKHVPKIRQPWRQQEREPALEARVRNQAPRCKGMNCFLMNIKW